MTLHRVFLAASLVLTCFVATLAATLAAIGGAQAETYPSRTIKLIVPYTPGSPVDAAARVLTQYLQQRLGQSVVVENRPGGGTTIGMKAAAAAAPDGYTLLFSAPQVTQIPVLFPQLGFDPLANLAPVATFVTWSHVLVVAPSVPAKNIAELVAYAKANPGKLVFGYGLGTAPHILGETFIQETGVDIRSIPYRGGEQARVDLLGGRVHINIAPVSTFRALIADHRVRPLAFTGPKRSPDLPDVPTMTESGYPRVGYNPDVWLGLMAPIKTPHAVIDLLNKAVNDSLRTPELRATLATLGFEPKPTTPEEFAAFLVVEAKKWPPLLKAAGLDAREPPPPRR
jgi:tripartite-type tricarboxylate transporter receptor subunit TctC